MAISLVDRERIPHCLFLGDLSVFCTEEILYEAFASFGYIIYLQIARSKSNQKHLLFGFLGYEQESSAIQAMRQMDGSIVCGRAIKIRWTASMMSPPTPLLPAATNEGQPYRPFCLKVTHLPTDCTLHELEQLFAHCMGVVKVKLKFTSVPASSAKNKHQKIPYGLIEFQSASTASMVMKQFGKEQIRGQTLELKWATSSPQMKKKKYSSPISQANNDKSMLKVERRSDDISLFVSFAGIHPDVRTTEASLRDVFGEYGTIEDVAIRLTLEDSTSRVQKGYAFIYFAGKGEKRKEGIAGALRASEAFMTDREVNFVQYHVELSKKLKRELGIVDATTAEVEVAAQVDMEDGVGDVRVMSVETTEQQQLMVNKHDTLPTTTTTATSDETNVAYLITPEPLSLALQPQQQQQQQSPLLYRHPNHHHHPSMSLPQPPLPPAPSPAYWFYYPILSPPSSSPHPPMPPMLSIPPTSPTATAYYPPPHPSMLQPLHALPPMMYPTAYHHHPYAIPPHMTQQQHHSPQGLGQGQPSAAPAPSNHQPQHPQQPQPQAYHTVFYPSYPHHQPSPHTNTNTNFNSNKGNHRPHHAPRQ